ncbi:VOC family protein [Sutcliffiella rhizosphaerae]|uniref:VOC domain-containing protein n=1 Tax=Sutcliffiella rhizosphaerae TaxID=2880967 RepID=A0ABM8YRF5_9BACI|nr:VOC family protein [Sutcliffiella rhizosphaerae]CAG9622554.1 hypothetical protein BACCIP111883_03345 [Sutcliffiella rhizosphaerae]
MKQVNRVSPIQNKVSGIFIPVQNVKEAKDWYCRILGIQEQGNIENGHLYVLPMDGVDVILDEMPSWKKQDSDRLPQYQTPAFMFKTGDIYDAFEFMKELGVELVTDIENYLWFAFKDPDGNLLMVCQ